ncbi:polyprotein [Hirsutella rhossiliensis]
MITLFNCAAKATSPHQVPLEQSDTQEINNLIAQGVFEFIRFDPVAHKGQRLFKARMVREVKGLGPTTRPYEKSRLVIQGYNDRDKENILTQSPTVQRQHSGYSSQLPPPSQVKPPSSCVISHKPELVPRYPPDTIIHVILPLYGIAESGLHWFVTYYRHHPAGFGMVAMQTDDTSSSPPLSSRPQKKKRSRRLSSARNQGASYRPRLPSIAAQVQQPEAPDYKTLNKRIQWQTDNLQRGLRYVPLAFSTAKLMVFTDGSFANNKDLSSQLGFVIVLANEEQSPADFTIRGNVLHWSSTKSKRVTRSVLASEIYGMVQGFDMAIVIATTLQAIVKQLDLPPTPLIVCTDSYSLPCPTPLSVTPTFR